jgi:nitrous oxide reductase accessory protein NosL
MKTIIISLFAFTVILFAGCKKEEPKDTTKPVVKTESKTAAVDSSIIRDGNVDVATLDLNKDGKVFQCPMHAEVISDKAGSCPLCKMELEEVTVQKAAENLK